MNYNMKKLILILKQAICDHEIEPMDNIVLPPKVRAFKCAKCDKITLVKY